MAKKGKGLKLWKIPSFAYLLHHFKLLLLSRDSKSSFCSVLLPAIEKKCLMMLIRPILANHSGVSNQVIITFNKNVIKIAHKKVAGNISHLVLFMDASHSLKTSLFPLSTGSISTLMNPC